jgi:hypothetical protein
VSLYYSRAVLRIMPYAAAQPPLATGSPTLIGHTNGGGSDQGSLYGWFSRPGNNICSHFQIKKTGVVEQYLPLDRQAYAQYAGNSFAWSAECEDDGDNTTPLTPEQIAAFTDIATELGVPWQKATVTGPGIGWHSLFTEWNRSGHDCPGSVRQAQFQRIIDQGMNEMTDTDLLKIAKLIKASQDTVIIHTREPLLAKIAALQADVDALKAASGSVG